MYSSDAKIQQKKFPWELTEKVFINLKCYAMHNNVIAYSKKYTSELVCG